MRSYAVGTPTTIGLPMYGGYFGMMIGGATYGWFGTIVGDGRHGGIGIGAAVVVGCGLMP